MAKTPPVKINPKTINHIVDIGVIVFMVISVLTILYYILVPSRTTFYADCSDTLYWANASYESGRLFSRDFIYATLQPFGGMLLMLPFIHFFGFSLTTHLIGMTLFAILFMLGLWFFCSSLEISRRQQGLLFSGVLLLLSSSAKLRELMWEHVIYYSLGILFSLLFFGLCFRLQKLLALLPTGEAPKHAKLKIRLYIGLLAALAFLVATDGMQVLIISTLPVVAALLAERYFDNNTPLLHRNNRPAVLLVGLIGVATLGGLVVLGMLSQGIRTGYTDLHMVYSPSSKWADNLLLLPDYWGRLLGFNAAAEEKIVSLPSLVELMRLALALVLLVVPVVAAANYPKLKNQQFRLLLWYHGILSGVLLLSHVVGSTANANWRLTPAVFSSVVVTLLYLMNNWKVPNAKRLTALIMALVCVIFAVNLHTMLTTPTRNGQNQHFYALVNALEEKELTYGYADFQTSQPLTVLSANEVKTRYVYITEDGVTPFYYQTEGKWYDDQPGVNRYFIVVSPQQYEMLSASPDWARLSPLLVETIPVADYQILVFAENPV